MRNLAWYIDTAKSISGCSSDRKLSQLLKMAPNWVATARKRPMFPTDETMINLAKIADIPLHTALLDLNIWRSTGKAKAVYQRLAEVAQTASLTAFIFFITALPASAMCQLASADIIYYVN
jgi:hypothetical protein